MLYIHMDYQSRLEEKIDRMLTEINSINVKIANIESRLNSMEQSYDRNNVFIDRIKSDALIREYEMRENINRLKKLEDITNALFEDNKKLRWLIKFSEDASYRFIWLLFTLILLSIFTSVSSDVINSLVSKFFR